MTKSKLFLSLSTSMQVALLSAQRLISTKFQKWSRFVGLEEPLEVNPRERQMILHLLTEDKEPIQVFVYLVKEEGMDWRAIQVTVLQKGEWTVSTQKFNPLLLTYETSSEREVFSPKNEKFIQRLNAGEQFALKSEVVDVWGDEETHLPWYDFIIFKDGSLIPLPLFFEAAGITDYPWDATAAQLTEILDNHFGDQSIGYLEGASLYEGMADRFHR